MFLKVLVDSTTLLVTFFKFSTSVFLLLFKLIYVIILSLVLARETYTKSSWSYVMYIIFHTFILNVITVYINFILDVKPSRVLVTMVTCI